MVGQNKGNYEHSQHAVFFKAREIAWIILAQAPRLVWPWEGAKEGAVVTEEDSWVKRSELCAMQMCVEDERDGKAMAAEGTSCVGSTENRLIWLKMRAGDVEQQQAVDVLMETVAMCAQILCWLYIQEIKSAWGGGRNQSASGTRLANLFHDHRKPLQAL